MDGDVKTNGGVSGGGTPVIPGRPGVGQQKPIEQISQAEAQAELREANDPDSAYWGQPGHRGVSEVERRKRVDRILRLTRVAWPDLAADEEGATNQDTTARGFRQAMRERGITREQVKEEIERGKETLADLPIEAGIQKVETVLRSEWGKDYEVKIGSAREIVDRFIKAPADLQFLETSQLGNDVEFIKLLSQVGEMLASRRKGRKGK